ncbi:MAG: DUF6242 domain-containing protein [Paludibacteraceae bacterium]|nr:DUF6242 domain-containing protein [Paludibacteraceae bacterium]
MKLNRILHKVTPAVLTAFLVVLVSCSKPNTYHDVNIKKFSFRTSTLAPDIKGIVFIVDTINNQIYNIDSVSYTSDITKVVPVVTCYSTPSEIRINDNVWNQTDSLNVTAPFKLTIVGQDKKTVRNFTVTVCKHVVDQDKITWASLTPSGIDDGLKAGKALYKWNHIILIGEDASGKNQVYSSPYAVSFEWQGTLENTIAVKTLYAPKASDVPDSLFALTPDGGSLVVISSDLVEKVYKMPDGVKAIDIIGEHKSDGILLLADKGGQKLLYKYFEGAVTASSGTLPAGFPTLGSSAKCALLLDAPTIKNVVESYVIGGKTDGNDFVRNVFSTDNGWYWTSVVKEPLSSFCFEGLNSAAAVWYDKRLFLYGGRNKDGLSPTYVSSDNGFSWRLARASECLPQSSVLATDISVISDSDDEYMYAVCGNDESGVFKIQCFCGRAVHKDFILK